MQAQDLEITVDEAKRLMDANAITIIDVREEWEIKTAAFPKAHHIPLARIETVLQHFDKKDRYGIVCHHGMRSLQACLYLRQAGYEAAQSIKGGIHQWSQSIDARVPCY